MKTIIREIIISLLVCLAVLLILSVMFYKFIPSNKVIPEKVTYQAGSDVKQEINEEVEDNSSLIIKTYEVTAEEIDGYERTDEYKPGKANPFAPVSTDDDTTIDSGDVNYSDGTGSDQSGNSSNNDNNNKSNSNSSNNTNSSDSGSSYTGGSLFEGTSSK